MEEPRVILLYGDDLAVQRAVGSELSDLLSRSLVLGFTTPLRRAYRTTFDLPISSLASAAEEEKVADWTLAFRGFLREWGGKNVLGKLAVQEIETEWWAHPFFIIDDGCSEYIPDIKEITKTFKDHVVIVNLGGNIPLKSNKHLPLSIGSRKEPDEIALFIQQSL